MSEREGDQVRRDLLQAISRLSDKYPELRICQLIGNVLPLVTNHPDRSNNDTYYIEDSQLLGWLLEYEQRVDVLYPRPGSPGIKGTACE